MPIQPAAAPAGVDLAIAAWNLMGGLDWNALPIVVEMLGIADVDQLIRHLAALREYQKAEG